MIDIAKLDDLASKQASLVTATNPASPQVVFTTGSPESEKSGSLMV
jgi:hypothetical protein